MKRATKTTKSTKSTKNTAKAAKTAKTAKTTKTAKRGTRPATKPARTATKPARTASAAPPSRKTAAKTTASKARARTPKATSPAQRVDFGKPVEGFFANQPSHIRPITDELRKLVEGAARDATAVIKWGVPVYEIGGKMMCSIGAHKAHVNLVLWGTPSSFPDPGGRLAGAKTGRHLRVTRVDEIPRGDVRRWLKIAAELARARA